MVQYFLRWYRIINTMKEGLGWGNALYNKARFLGPAIWSADHNVPTWAIQWIGLVFPALETLSPALETAPITSDLWCGIPSPGNTISSPGEHTNLLYSETPKKERVLDVINLNDIRPIVQLNLWKPALATVKKSPISALGITILGLNARLTLHDNPLLDVW